MFKKYAERIPDENERKSMRAIYIAKWVFAALTIASAVVAVAIAIAIIVASGAPAEGVEGIGLAAYALAFLIFLMAVAVILFINLIITVALAIAFKVKYKKICATQAMQVPNNETNMESFIDQINNIGDTPDRQ